MDFSLNDEQQLLKDLIERFVQERYDLPKRVGYRANPGGYSSDNWTALAELGLLSLPFAAEHGGMAGGAVETITVMEAIGRSLAVEPYLDELIVSAGMLARAGSDAQRDAWLARVMAGEAHLALAHIERGARYDLARVVTRARTIGGALRLEGEKSFVPQGEVADAFIVSARVSDGGGIGFFLVPADAPGLERRDYRLVDGTAVSLLKLRGVPAGERLPGGFDELLAVVDDARIAACAEMVGVMSLLFDTTLEHVRSRRQFGMTLGSFQVIQHRLADQYVALEQSRSQLYRGALAAADDPGRGRAIAGMKSFVSHAAIALGEECIHFHGAMGTTDELIVGHGHKRLMVLSTLFGDSDRELQRFNGLAA